MPDPSSVCRPFPALQDSHAGFAEAVRRHEAGDLDAARQGYKDLLDQPPLMAAALHQLALLASAQGDAERAAGLYRKAIQLDPAITCAYGALSAALDTQDNPQAATAVLLDLASYYYVQNDNAAAERVYRQVLARDPGSYIAHANLGTSLVMQGHHREAAIEMLRALKLCAFTAPEMAHLLDRLAGLPGGDMLSDAALPAGLTGPDCVVPVETCLTSLGTVLQCMGFSAAALLCLRMAVDCVPGDGLVHWNYALGLLSQRSFASGWAEYEWRWQWRGFPVPQRRLPAAPWRGEALDGKRVLIWGEQGFGDILQFAPLVLHLKQRWPSAEILFEASQPLLRLLCVSLPGIRVIPQTGTPCTVACDQAIDYAVPLLSLPHRLQLVADTLPLAVQYLHAPPETRAPMHRRLEQVAHPRIGIVWASRPYPDTRRSVPFEHFQSLMAACPAAWFSLQVGERQQDLVMASPGRVNDLAPFLLDFAETAAAIAEMDLIITVDTAVAHLAGGMGKPVWTLLPAIADWRWADEDGATAWYPSMRLFRPVAGENWVGLLGRVQLALSVWLQQAA